MIFALDATLSLALGTARFDGGDAHAPLAAIFMFIYHLFICYLSFVLFILLLGLLLRRGYGFAGFDQGFI